MNDEELTHLVRAAFEEERAPQEVKDRTRAQVFSQVEKPADRPRSSRKPLKRVGWMATGALAACLVFFAIVFVGGLPQAGDRDGTAPQQGVSAQSDQPASAATEEIPTAYVDIDINPSIELALAKDNTVLQASALNDDGAAVLSEADPVGLPYDEALASLMGKDTIQRFIDPSSFVQFSVTADDPDQERTLIAASEACLARVPCRSVCDRVTSAIHHDAHEHGMGSGRYAAALELIELDDRITLEDCKHMTMRQLQDAIAAARGSASDEGSDQVRGYGPHHSEGYRHHRSACVAPRG